MAFLGRVGQNEEVRQRSGLSLSQQSQGSKRHLWTEPVSRYLPITCLGTWEPHSYTTWPLRPHRP